MNQRRVFTQGRIGRQSRGQIVVVAINEADGLFSDLFVNGCNSRDDIANVTQLFADEKFLVLDRKTESLARAIAGRQDRRDARERARPAHVEALDLCVRDGTTKKLGL